MSDPLADPRESWLSVLEKAKDFRDIGHFQEMPPEVFFPSHQWADWIFRPGMSPQGAKVRHSYHLAQPNTFDLIRHEIPTSGLPIQVTETSLFLTIFVPSGKDVNVVGLSVMNLTPSTRFESIPGDPRGTLSTAPQRTLTQIHIWSDRVDAVISNAGLSFVCYKIHPEAPRFASPTRWFPDRFRNRDLRQV